MLGRVQRSKEEQTKVDELVKVMNHLDKITESIDELYNMYDFDNACDLHNINNLLNI